MILASAHMKHTRNIEGAMLPGHGVNLRDRTGEVRCSHVWCLKAQKARFIAFGSSVGLEG
jgi:hypothetical protein